MTLKSIFYTVDTDDHPHAKRGDLRVRFPETVSSTSNGGSIDYCVDRDDDGNLFHYIPNLRNTNGRHTFSGRIKDAYDAIFEGEGDVVKRNFFGGFGVIRYVDREHGENLRGKFLEGFKDTRFGYLISFDVGSFGGPFLYSKDKTIYFGRLSEENLFQSEEEARDALLEWKKEFDKVKQLYLSWCQEKEKSEDPKTFELTNELSTLVREQGFISDCLCTMSENSDEVEKFTPKLSVRQEVIENT